MMKVIIGRKEKLMEKETIYLYEPWFFIFFGIFHLHRIWGIIDRKSYADFWLGIMNNRGAFYYILMGTLAFLCILGLVAFFKNVKQNYWWRWIYVFGGSYVLFDLFAISVKFVFWNQLLNRMFDIKAGYWNLIWCGFVLLGGFVFILGIYLLKEHYQLKKGR